MLSTGRSSTASADRIGLSPQEASRAGVQWVDATYMRPTGLPPDPSSTQLWYPTAPQYLFLQSMPDTTAAIDVTAEEMSSIYTATYCITAVCVLLVYDWLLCLGQEVRFMWNRRSGFTVASLVYTLSRYSMIIQYVLAIATTFPMSDLSCIANGWTENITEILAMFAFSAFSALRAYALSNRNTRLTALIVLLALPPVTMYIIQCIYRHPVNLPSPFNCSASSSLSVTLSLRIDLVLRVSRLAAELLVIGITWWYSYQTYRISRGINLGETISSFLVYNGSGYFLFLATLYILDIILHTASVPDVQAIRNADNLMLIFYDAITSIVTCRFLLAIRQFDSNIVAGTYSETGFLGVPAHTTSTVLEFAAQPCDSLPAFIASFSHPVHVPSALSEVDSDATVDDGSEWRELAVVTPIMEAPSCSEPKFAS